jgi:hypothetical protein
LHGVQGVECSNHSVPTKKPQEIQSLSGGWIFFMGADFWRLSEMCFLVANWLPIEIGLSGRAGNHGALSLRRYVVD